MLDPRLYRAALVPVLLAILVAAFSLENRPRAIGTTLAPDAFDGRGATTRLEELAETYPDRAPGGAGDTGLADRVAAELRTTLGAGRVTLDRFSAATSERERDLVNVVGVRPGRPGAGLVVVAHRDADGPGAKAALSGTAAMLELARVTGEGRLRRTITFASTSGGSAGLAGALRLAGRLAGPVDAVLVLGDVAGERVRKPFVVGWSTGEGQAPLRLRRTVESAVRVEAGTDPGGSRASTQWARLAFPITAGEQGPFGAAGFPAVLLSVSGERGPAAGEPLAPGRLEVFGRAALRTITALDNGPDIDARPEALVVTQRKVLPAWAVRLLGGALLFAPLVVAVDALARLRRRREPIARWLRWALTGALPFLAAGLIAVLCGATGLLGGVPDAPPPPAALDVDGTALGGLIAVALAGLLGLVGLRPVALRALGAAAPPREEGAAVAVLMMGAALAVAVWLVNPHAGFLVAPALHLWLLAVFLRGPIGILLVLAGTVPLLAVHAAHAIALGLSPWEWLWLGVLLVAGGGVSAATWMLWSLVAGTFLAALLVAARRPPRGTLAPEAVTVRGPVTYAGPGSLGGTESALRR